MTSKLIMAFVGLMKITDVLEITVKSIDKP